ncbi:hypothetical protein HanXRQr2_Chr07g0286031 [Helianthus annuus]|uniref:Uncharacterized protein n=1 Tax=Helianthus annuus TaxID=4232 RepID=A0A9K3IJ53_HELAN|nr:hypothetical protein HanXRQr2_Chr07g0286031 [Helianthus annuus]KAJ0904015.1 hypothetical protein HanPSC8_Chr07g0276891 [Helianthus annuus]
MICVVKSATASNSIAVLNNFFISRTSNLSLPKGLLMMMMMMMKGNMIIINNIIWKERKKVIYGGIETQSNQGK